MKNLFATLTGAALFWGGHALATMERGYAAIGGEIAFLLLIPTAISLLEVRE